MVGYSQVEVLGPDGLAVALQAAVGLLGGQGLFEALAPVSTLLQPGHDHLGQVLLEPLEVLPEAVT